MIRISYHLAGEAGHGYDKEAVEVGDYVLLGDQQGVKIGGEGAAHLLE